MWIEVIKTLIMAIVGATTADSAGSIACNLCQNEFFMIEHPDNDPNHEQFAMALGENMQMFSWIVENFKDGVHEEMLKKPPGVHLPSESRIVRERSGAST